MKKEIYGKLEQEKQFRIIFVPSIFSIKSNVLTNLDLTCENIHFHSRKDFKTYFCWSNLKKKSARFQYFNVVATHIILKWHFLTFKRLNSPLSLRSDRSQFSLWGGGIMLIKTVTDLCACNGFYTKVTSSSSNTSWFDPRKDVRPPRA